MKPGSFASVLFIGTACGALAQPSTNDAAAALIPKLKQAFSVQQKQGNPAVKQPLFWPSQKPFLSASQQPLWIGKTNFLRGLTNQFPLVPQLKAPEETPKGQPERSLSPGIYETAPYSCIVIVPQAHPDEIVMTNPATNDTTFTMRVVTPELRFIPRK